MNTNNITNRVKTLIAKSSVIIRGSFYTPKKNMSLLMKNKRKNAVLSVALADIRMRMAVLPVLTLDAQHRTWTRAITVGSHSKRENSLDIAQRNLPTLCMTFYLRN